MGGPSWAKLGPSNACSIELVGKFNEQVGCDILFVRKFIIFHTVDRCTRWRAAMLTPRKEEGTLVKAIETLWMSNPRSTEGVDHGQRVRYRALAQGR
eukprot:10520882-Lingulodinium_polyedra.AAC.1